MQSNFKIVLYAPEIPGNTGSIGRTCLALSAELILIKPYAFDISEKAVRRAGLDYWKHVQIKEFENWQDFLASEKPNNSQLLFFENDGKTSYYQAPYQKNCYLVFGSETKGLPPDIYEKYAEQLYHMPMYSEHIRSLNLSNAATAVAYECQRHLLLQDY
jgi:tRNA (cytidine/uridine-2'-O-)-methyltransferase